MEKVNERKQFYQTTILRPLKFMGLLNHCCSLDHYAVAAASIMRKSSTHEDGFQESTGVVGDGDPIES